MMTELEAEIYREDIEEWTKKLTYEHLEIVNQVVVPNLKNRFIRGQVK